MQVFFLTDRDLRGIEHTQVYRSNPAGRKSSLLPRHDSAGYVDRRQAAFWTPDLFPERMRSGLKLDELWRRRRILIGVYLYPDELPFIKQYGTDDARQFVARCITWAALEFRRVDRAILALQYPWGLRAFERAKLIRLIGDSTDCEVIADALHFVEAHEARVFVRRIVDLRHPEGAVAMLRASHLAERHRRKLIEVVRASACAECIALALTYVKLPFAVACELAEKLRAAGNQYLVQQVLVNATGLDVRVRAILE